MVEHLDDHVLFTKLPELVYCVPFVHEEFVEQVRLGSRDYLILHVVDFSTHDGKECEPPVVAEPAVDDKPLAARQRTEDAVHRPSVVVPRNRDREDLAFKGLSI